MDFYGDFDELKALIASQGYEGTWVERNENLVQFRVSDQVVIKWRPKNTGNDGTKLGVQGPYRAAEPILRAIRAANAKAANAAVGSDSNPIYQYTAVNVEPEFATDYDSELVIALVCSVGTNLKPVTDLLEERLKAYGYSYNPIRISSDIISVIANVNEQNYYTRTDRLMTEGNNLRESTGDYGFLAKLRREELMLLGLAKVQKKANHLCVGEHLLLVL